MATSVQEIQKLEEVLLCSFCKGPFDDPRILPHCGHTACYKCIRELSGWNPQFHHYQLFCPECDAYNFYEDCRKGLLQNLTIANAQAKVLKLRSQVESLKSENECLKAARQAGSEAITENSKCNTCPHVFSKPQAVYCEHCSSRFCDACQYMHIEQIRMTAVCNASQLKTRLERTCDALEQRQPEINEYIDRTLSDIKSHIKKSFEGIIAVIRASEGRLTRKACQMAERRKRRFDEIADAVKDAAKNADLANRVNRATNTSVFQNSLDDMLKLSRDISEHYQPLLRLESMLEVVGSPELFDLQIKIDDELESKCMKLVEETALSLAPFKPNYLDPPTDMTKLIRFAAQSGDLDSLMSILNDKNLPGIAKAYLVEHKGVGEVTPLILASRQGHLDIVKFLVVDCDADLMAYDARGFTAIHHAAANGHGEIVDFLLDTNPKLISAITRKQKTVIDIAKDFHHWDSLKAIVEKNRR